MYCIINTDWDARENDIACDLWFQYKMAFAGDYDGNKCQHARLFSLLKVGDVLFMYHSKKDPRQHSKKGFVGVGEVKEEWDNVVYEGEPRYFYKTNREIYEYRITVDWLIDWRETPKSASDLSLFTTPRMWARINPDKYPVQSLIQRYQLSTEGKCP